MSPCIGTVCGLCFDMYWLNYISTDICYWLCSNCYCGILIPVFWNWNGAGGSGNTCGDNCGGGRYMKVLACTLRYV